MKNSLRFNKILWSITTAFTFLAALAGVVNKDIYTNVFFKDFLPGTLLQDLLTMTICIVLFILISTTKEHDDKKKVIIIGLIGSFFYLYGIFTIERVYNWFYLLYAAIFALSFWSITYTLAGFRSEAYARIQINAAMLKMTAVSSIVIAVLFTVLWTTALIPLMRDHNRIEFFYSIYILDLCFVMPSFFMTAVMSLRKMPLGIMMAPALMILGFFVIFPLALNELAKPAAGMTMDYGSMAVSFFFSAFMLVVGGLHLKMIRFE